MNTMHGASSARAPQRAALVAIMTLPFVAFVALGQPRALWAGALAITCGVVALLARRQPLVALHAGFWTLLLAALVAEIPWPASFVAPFVPLFFARRFSTTARVATRWLRLGSLDRPTLALMLFVVVTSSTGLVAWFLIARPNIDALTGAIPVVSTPVFVAAALAFSVANAVWEEFLLKGMAWESAALAFRSRVTVNVVQSILFGFVHFHGFPSGVVGVGLAAIYGFLLGLVRERSRGMLAPIITHIFADVTICALVFLRYRGIL